MNWGFWYYGWYFGYFVEFFGKALSGCLWEFFGFLSSSLLIRRSFIFVRGSWEEKVLIH